MRFLEMCGEKRKLVSSYKAPDRIVDGVFVRGEESKTWATCGKRVGHRGDHGPWPRWRMWMHKVGL